ncbi:recombination and DNA strand exchange inhibitor protein [cyanobacterium endosymbiont of Rhopalodia gibberula]|uniref:endonuclease MutS2 n=1 Tax=cyanobacterium endosymbiont of Rhopalodia gibberula TaxID=1763363 RepID=UPI000DC6EF53|nr:endonuclease MutS2 [cyanobacterium endosymbiont of Rhopalodia gibberula]BBA79711.1 recombination and DNA strand exchange inhibitor protein [cyanobacterium endosymbiont of Rhopalodia gibberula]
MIQQETLNLLEWPRLCQHLSTFAETKLGVLAARKLSIPDSIEESKQLLAQTKEIYRLEQSLEVQWSFDGITDIGDSLERAKLGGILSGQELLNIATTLAGVRRLRRIINNQEDCPILEKLVADIRTYPELEQKINHCIDEAGKVADRASVKLGEIRQNLKDVRDQIYQKLQNIIHQQGGAVQEAVITQRGDRFVIPVKAPKRDQIRGIVHDTSSTGATIYVEPSSIVQWGNQRRQYLRQEQVEIEAILRALTEQVALIYSELDYLLGIATVLDLTTAKALYSLYLEGNAPEFIDPTEGELITLRQLRHPLLVWQQQHEQGSPVVPINVQVDPKIRVVAITGPNTGGKTVTLKTIGLAALMAKVGLFIPAREPVKIPWFRQILADIGDEQSIEQSLSTFSGHIRRIVRILESLTTTLSLAPSFSLVLLDEVGAGTDPAEGSALAVALLHYLADHALLTIASTHYGELKTLKYQDDRFENASVEFDDRTLSPTYRLLWGIPGRSNALTIAGRLGLQMEIIEEAKTRIGGFSEEINEVIAGLEKQRREQEQKAQEASNLLQQTKKFYTEVLEKASSLQQREQSLKQYQEQEVQKAIAQAKEEIAQVIRQLQKGKQTGQQAQKATATLREIGERQLSKLEQCKPAYKPQVGETIKLPRFGQTADVLAIDEAQEEVTVRFGLMKMTVSFTKIESLDGKKVEVIAKRKVPIATSLKTEKSQYIPMIKTSQNTLDIRGSRIAEAESNLENAISKATKSGVLWVIHGKGTGKLRQGVHEFLKLHPQIDKFELAPQNEGGSGVTIAYLK